MLTDVRYALRTVLKNPGFAATAVATLALGIGANTAIFSVVNAVMLKPLPYRDPGRLVMVWEDSTSHGYPKDTPAPGNFTSWRAQNHVFEDMAALAGRAFNLTGAGEPEKIEGLKVSASLFTILGVQPALGRAFLPQEDAPGARKAVVLSDALWQRRFARDPQIVGKNIALNGESYTVTGVMPRGFRLPMGDSQLWTPLAFDAEEQNNHDSHYLFVMARLKSGVALRQAAAEMETIARRLQREFPATNTGVGAVVAPLREEMVGDARTALLVLLAAVGFVLLIACANVASLLVARAASRSKEIAVRAAIGAGRYRLVRQLVTESLILAVMGGVAGLVVALWGMDTLVRLAPEDVKFFGEPSLDASVLGFTIVVSLLCGFVFGLAPAFSASKLNLHHVLKEGGRTSAAHGRSKMHSALVVAEIALALVLLTGAGLLLRSFYGLLSVHPGFQTDHLLTMRIVLPDSKYGELRQKIAFYRDTLARIERLPGVHSAACITWLPMAFTGGSAILTVEGRPAPAGQEPIAITRVISPDYFRTMSVPLRRGRAFDQHDTEASPGVAIISETMARKLWPNEDAIGKRFKYGNAASRDPWLTIVGVSGDVRQFQLDQAPKPEAYLPYMQAADFFGGPRDVAVRTAGDPLHLARAVRNEIWAVDPDLPISGIQTMERLIAGTVTPQRFNMLLLAVFAAVALVLAAVGIYGLLAFSVTQRTHEIGIRMALGARRGEVLRLVVKPMLVLILTGMAIGTAGSLALTRAMASLLFGVTATDPATFLAVPLLLSAVALSASIVPALRAARVDPLVSLRYE
jgi:putative ABC transport system permease protein